MQNTALRDLATWYLRQKRTLPWRDQPTPYRVWVSEIMLQQTQVATVIPYFERFLTLFPTVESLAKASEPEVLRAWSGLGYYSRARNLHRGAKLVVGRGEPQRQTRWPKTREQWLEVPGVGPYTAGAILSIAFDQPESLLDGNVERVLARVRTIKRGEFYKARLWRLATRFVRVAHGLKLRPSEMNQALMELGATVCTPTRPLCGICPVSSVCRAFQNGVTANYPEKKPPKKWVRVQEKMHCVVDQKGRVLLRLRRKDEWRAGLWDFLDERDFQALKLRSKADRAGKIESRHVVTHHKIERQTTVWKIRSGQALPFEPKIPREIRWVALSKDDELPSVPIGSPLKKVLREVFPEVSRQKSKPGSASSRSR